MKRASTGRQESLQFETGQHGFTNLSFMFAAAGRQGSVRVNQMQVHKGRNGSKQFTMRSAIRECSHTQPDFEPGPYGIKTASTGFHPY
jgi:hypothetical protein